MMTAHGYLWEGADRLLREGLGMAPAAPNHTHMMEAWCRRPSSSLPLPGWPWWGLSTNSLPFLSPCSHSSSKEWQKVSKSEREKMGVTVQDDGEFW